MATRLLLGAGFSGVTNLSGGFISLQRKARTTGFNFLKVDLLPVEIKKVEKQVTASEEKKPERQTDANAPLVIDVRTPEEFETGAYPGAVNIPMDELMYRLEELGNDRTRPLVVYCATGARSAYAQQMLMHMGYQNVRNGGGLSAMMAGRNTSASPAAAQGPLVVDVRTPQEFRSGAYPGAVNIPLDELGARMHELGNFSREIVLYCASGARSAYGQRLLQQLGYTKVKNGGGIMQMMMRR